LSDDDQMSKYTMYIGGVNRPPLDEPNAKANARGIEAYTIDSKTGEATWLGVTAGVDNTTYLSLSPDGRLLAACSELIGVNEGLVTLFERRNGKLAYVNQQTTRGDTTAHLSFDTRGRAVAVTNYSLLPSDTRPGRSVVVYPIKLNGELGSLNAETTCRGQTGPHATRQERSHAHCVRWTTEGLLLVTDLGLDRVFCYRWNEGTGSLVIADEVAVLPGSGPRHIEFHPRLPLVYVVNELIPGILTFRLDGVSGRLELIALCDFPGAGACSAIRITPQARQLLVGDRQRNAIGQFDLDLVTGIPRFEALTPCGGHWPRDLNVSPDGALLAVANQESDEVSLLSYDEERGKLTPLNRTLACGTPMCIVFAQASL
jgi:6-phosphogluconolactonase